MNKNMNFAIKCFELVSTVLPQLSKHLDEPCKIYEFDEDKIEFEIDGFSFYIAAEEMDVKCIGGTKPGIQFSLYKWVVIHGNRWTPDEEDNVKIAESRSIWECVKVAFAETRRYKVDGLIEGIMTKIELEEIQKDELVDFNDAV